ncbi:uncharacterized protein F5891DRAFT_1183574 [Suillus fuscotomentosus]|uniref:Uncharacterized protein n=1 Tax=Suillus fuscotomentosus TaxID=1912939 RepID=A0AAD4HQ65_9AGAM|nr:uncharacterized protein F5891DRAFT_1183574 [Suillus fuscotomentosus]KAG1904933.1 hypothetical protein F5891DRAFT_1183574 [Suillus fuscotomentosus]
MHGRPLCMEGHCASPILIDDTPPQSQTIPKQKLVPIVEIWNCPPPRPLKASKGKKPAHEVIPVDMSSDIQVSSESDAEDEFKEDKDALESEDSEYEDEVATSRKRKVKGTRGHRSHKQRAPSSNVQVVEPPCEGRKAVKGKGKAADKDTGKEQKIAKKVHYVSVATEPDTEQDGHKALCLRDGPQDSLQPRTQCELPKPKQVIPGSSESARQAVLYSEGKRQPHAPGGSNTAQDARQGSLDTSQEVLQGGSDALQGGPDASQGGHDTSQVAQQGGLRGPRTSRWDLPLRGKMEDTFTQASDHLQVPSPTPSSPSPQSREQLRSLLPAPYDQHNTTAQPNGQQHVSNRSLPLPPSRGSMEYQPMTQQHLPSGVNYVPGVNAARQPQHSMDACNTMYTYPPPHHPYYPTHSESYEQGTGIRKKHSPAPRHDGLDPRQNWPRYVAYAEDERMIRANSTSPLPGLMQYSSSPPQSEGN